MTFHQIPSGLFSHFQTLPYGQTWGVGVGRVLEEWEASQSEGVDIRNSQTCRRGGRLWIHLKVFPDARSRRCVHDCCLFYTVRMSVWSIDARPDHKSSKDFQTPGCPRGKILSRCEKQFDLTGQLQIYHLSIQL